MENPKHSSKLKPKPILYPEIVLDKDLEGLSDYESFVAKAVEEYKAKIKNISELKGNVKITKSLMIFVEEFVKLNPTFNKIDKKAIVIRVLHELFDKTLTDEEQLSIAKDIDMIFSFDTNKLFNKKTKKLVNFFL
jgi:hypothetical protein